MTGFLSVPITLMNRHAGSQQEAARCAVIKTDSVFQRFLSVMESGTAGMDQMKLTVVSSLLSDLIRPLPCYGQTICYRIPPLGQM